MSTQLAIALAACADDPLTQLKPQIEVEPASLDFGDGIVNAENVLMLTVRNKGGGELLISGAEIDPAGSVFSVRDVPERVLPISEKLLPVIFVPLRAHDVYNATLTIHSDDPQNPAVQVPLTGKGGVREIEVFPTEIDFGTVNEGDSPRRPIEIRNLGGDPLIIGARLSGGTTPITFTSTSTDMGLAPGTFTLGIIPPKTSTVVEVVYSPHDLGGDRGVVTIYSNDEDEPEVTVPVRGNANLKPRAIAWGCEKPLAPGQVGCDNAELVRSLTASFRRIVGLDGRRSYDPEGAPIQEFRWTITQEPNGSHAAIFYSTDDLTLRKRSTGDIEVDKVGTYELSLAVKDERGLWSDTSTASIVRILPRDLEVLLRWDFATDVDVHFVHPGGMPGDYGTGQTHTSTGTDCSAFNRQPNWNDPGTFRDDPTLDKDDVTGRGPEIVSLDLPEDGGTYHVFAHYCDSRMTHAPVNVTVEVYVRGDLIQTVPDNGIGYPMLPSELWQAADVTWNAAGPSVSIVEMSTSAPTPAPQLCFIP